MYIFDNTELKPFDIVLVRFPEDRLSKAIRRLCKSEFSHAIIYLGNNAFVEASQPIVTLFSTQRYFFTNLDNLKVLRLNDQERKSFDEVKAEATLRSLTYCNYSDNLLTYMKEKNITPEIANRFAKDGKWTGGVVCSSLVTLPFYSGGISFFNKKEPYYADFGDIENATFLDDVTNKVLMEYNGNLPADTVDYFELKPTGSILEKQSEAVLVLNHLVEKILKDLEVKYPQIKNEEMDFLFSSWEDIYPYMMTLFRLNKGKEIDTLIYEKIKETGYDNLWFVEAHSKPEFFFPSYEMAARPQHHVLPQITKEHYQFRIDSLSEYRMKNEKNLEAVLHDFLRCPAKTFHTLVNMYRSYQELLDISIMQYEYLIDKFNFIHRK